MTRNQSVSAAFAAVVAFALAAGCTSASPAAADAGGAAGAAGGKDLAPFLGQWQRVSGTFSQVCDGMQDPAQAQTGTSIVTVTAAAPGSGADLGADLGNGTVVCLVPLTVNGSTATLVPPGPTCANTAETVGFTTETLTVSGATMNALQVTTIVYAVPAAGTGHCTGTAMSSYSKLMPDGSAGG